MSEAPFGLESWVDYLADKSLPVMAHSRQFIMKRLAAPNVALMDLSPALQADPVLCLHIMRRANALNKNHDTDIRTLDHALSSLGVMKIRELLDDIPILQMNNRSVAHRQYLYSVANSIHAGMQVRDWIMQVRPSQVNQLYTGAMLYGFIYWALWRFSPHTASTIYTLMHDHHRDQAQAETEVLGCPAQAIAHALAVRWQLPELVISALNHDVHPDKRVLVMLSKRARGDELTPEQERAINHVVHAAWTPIKMANWLAHSVHFGWYGRRANRIKLLVANYLRQSRDVATARIHRNAVQAAHSFATPGIMSPAFRLIMAPDDHPVDFRMESRAVHPAAAKPASSSAEPRLLAGKLLNEGHFNNQLYQLNNADKHAQSLGELLQILASGLHKGVGLPRTAILLVNQQGSTLATKLVQGDGVPEALAHLSLPLEQSGIFQKLCQQPGALWVTPRNIDKVAPQMPEAFRAVCHENEFFLMSLFLGKKPVAVIYCDGSDAGEVRPLHYNAYKQLIQAAGRGLTRYYRARQQTRS